MQRIAAVFCVSVETIVKALQNEAGDNIEDDLSYVLPLQANVNANCGQVHNGGLSKTLTPATTH